MIPEVSVVIPTHRRPALLKRSIESALCQGSARIEVVVVSDGPDPETNRLVSAIGDPRIRLLELASRSGAPAARNAGVMAARAPYVGFLDDDDEWLPAKLSTQLNLAGPNLFVACRATVVESGSQRTLPRRLPRDGEHFADYLFTRHSPFRDEGSLATSMILAPRDLLREIPFRANLRKHQEADWAIRATALGAKCVFAPEVLVVLHSPVGPRVSNSGDWRDSLAWVQSVKGLVPASAYSAFVLTSVASFASRDRDLSAIPQLLSQACQNGPVNPIHLAVFASLFVLPASARARIRHSTLEAASKLSRWTPVGRDAATRFAHDEE